VAQGCKLVAHYTRKWVAHYGCKCLVHYRCKLLVHYTLPNDNNSVDGEKRALFEIFRIRKTVEKVSNLLRVQNPCSLKRKLPDHNLTSGNQRSKIKIRKLYR